ncbi:protein RFT1 homolog [Diaphorina citri]|uniref:Protein RFT1 homolog n=1 Tax=Diaphorina citri TaxID=121845 RepID=A0A3Q0IS90_DIACI|nr:protein RFT1 homolog [Diaphorina citri]
MVSPYAYHSRSDSPTDRGLTDYLLFWLQIMFRGVTFGMNVFVLRHLNQDVIGVMNVRLLLLESTVLFLSREAFRRACISQTTQHNWPQVINLIWLTVPICSVLCVLFGFIWLHVLTIPDPSVTTHYAVGVWSIAISCVMEMCCEPLYLVAQAFLFIRLRVVCESVIVGVRTATFTLLVFTWASPGAVLAFSIAQLLSIGAYMVSLYAYFWWYLRQRAAITREAGQASRETLDGKETPNVGRNETPDGKETTTENETPSRGRNETASGVNETPDGGGKRVPLERKQSLEEEFPFRAMTDFLPKRLENESQMDVKLLRLTWSFMKQGLLKQLLTDGERYVMTVFPLLTFSEQGTFDVVNNLGSLAARFLFRPIEESCYFYFSQVVQRDLPIEKQNQVSLEVVVVNTMDLDPEVGGSSPSQIIKFMPSVTLHLARRLFSLPRYNKTMVALSIIFLSTNWLFTMLVGSVGFILANCFNMATRIVQSIRFIRFRYKHSGFDPLRGLIPGKLFSISLLISLVVTVLSEYFLYETSKLYHFLVGAVCFLLVVACWIKEEKELVPLIMSKIRPAAKTE